MYDGKKLIPWLIAIFMAILVFDVGLVAKEANHLNKEYKAIIVEQWYELYALKSTYVMKNEEIKNAKEMSFGVFKSYMDYGAITVKNSPQYKLQQKAYTDEQGLRKIDDYYMIATGSFYGEVGDIYKVTLSSGKVFEAIKSDAKSDIHTDELHQVCLYNGSVIEFIVDMEHLADAAKRSGSISSIGFDGSVIGMEKVNVYKIE